MYVYNTGYYLFIWFSRGTLISVHTMWTLPSLVLPCLCRQSGFQSSQETQRGLKRHQQKFANTWTNYFPLNYLQAVFLSGFVLTNIVCLSQEMVNYILLSILWIGYELDGPRFESQQGQDIYSVIKNIQTASGAHPASYSLSTGVFPQG